MGVKQYGLAQDRDAVVSFVRTRLQAASLARLPEVFAQKHPESLYYLPNRNGVSVVVLPTSALNEEQIIKLLTYRLAQYLAVNMVDREKVYLAGWEHEPRANISAGDIHLIAGSAETGEILCYLVLTAPPDAPPGVMIREEHRPLFPVEKLFGWGVFNRLCIMPDLRVSRVREGMRFVRNQGLAMFDPLATRGAVEIPVALIRVLTGPLKTQVDALIGDIEEGVTGQNFAFFHTPMVILHATPPYSSEDYYLSRRYQTRTVYPFAALIADLTETTWPRLSAIETALDLPGKQGLAALFALNREVGTTRSSLEPPGGLEPLTMADLPQQGVPMESRREMFYQGERLRSLGLFSGLSHSEAAALRSFMERVTVEAGDTIVRQGEEGDAIYLIEDGQADVLVHEYGGGSVRVNQLGPGEYFGEIGLLTGGPRTADVIATTPMTLLKLTRETYMRYLAHRAEVEQQMALTAARRAANTVRRLSDAGS